MHVPLRARSTQDGGAGIQQDGALAGQLRQRPFGDALLLTRPDPEALQNAWLAVGLGHGQGPAVDAPHQPPLFENGEITPHGFGGDAEPLRDLRDVHAPLGMGCVDDGFLPFGGVPDPGGRGGGVHQISCQGSTVTLMASPRSTIPNASITSRSLMRRVMRSATGTSPLAM